MNLFLTCFLLLHSLCSFHSLSTEEIQSRQDKVSKALNDTLLNNVQILVKIEKKSDYSNVLDVCNVPQDSSLFDRTGCCTPSDVKHLFNVLVQDNKFVLFSEKPKTVRLPAVTSVKTQQKIHLNVPVSSINDKFSTSKQCLKYFNGTLHIVGRSTVKNVYHAIADNVLPLASQILLDAFLAPEYLHLPRMLVSDSKEEGVPHIGMMYKLMSAGMTTLQQVEGTCFRRVVWGHGPHLFYLDTMIALRRLSSEFIRNFALQMYDIKVPAPFTAAAAEFKDRQSLIASGSRKEMHPLRVTLYSRGSSGKGRSIKGEDLLVNALRAKGALVAHLSDFGALSLDQQLSFAIHSDLILGLHGAAIAHGVFMSKGAVSVELKTQYAYESILFGLVADSRQGIHGQVDVRKYLIPGGHRPIDSPLVNRTLNAIEVALRYQLAVYPEYQRFIESSVLANATLMPRAVDEIVPVPSAWPGDFVFGPSSYPDSTMHILGPLQSNQTKICHNMLFAKLRIKLGIKAESFHCDICTTYVVRR